MPTSHNDWQQSSPDVLDTPGMIRTLLVVFIYLIFLRVGLVALPDA